MKTVKMERSFDYRPKPGTIIHYRAEHTYERVPEAAAEAIKAAGAGRIIAANKVA